MNQKITFPELVSAISEVTGYSKHLCEEFLKELFTLIASTLASGENVKIKRIGTFKIVTVEARKSVNVSTGEEIEIPEHKKVSFTPDKELADAVNLPFAAFETIELKDSVTDEMLLSSETDVTPLNQTSEHIDNGPVPLTDWDNDDDETNPLSEEIDSSNNQNVVTTSEIESDNDDNPNAYNSDPDNDLDKNSDDNSNYSDDTSLIDAEPIDSQSCPDTEKNNISEQIQSINDYDDSNESEIINEVYDATNDNTIITKRKGFIPGFIWGMIAAVVIIGIAFGTIYYLSPNILIKSHNNVNIAKTENRDSIIDNKSIEPITTNNTKDSTNNINTVIPDTRPSDEIVYDTISLTRFLTTMAREHYGNYHLWPYIYEENSKILGHPDRIRPGTRVVIPAKSKYNIDPNDAECIAKAKKKGVEIYNRYKK